MSLLAVSISFEFIIICLTQFYHNFAFVVSENYRLIWLFVSNSSTHYFQLKIIVVICHFNCKRAFSCFRSWFKLRVNLETIKINKIDKRSLTFVWISQAWVNYFWNILYLNGLISVFIFWFFSSKDLTSLSIVSRSTRPSEFLLAKISIALNNCWMLLLLSESCRQPNESLKKSLLDLPYKKCTYESPLFSG